jgi:hypothetical protein
MSRISFNKVDAITFDTVAEIAACDAEGLPRLLAESDHQLTSQDAAAKALLATFEDSDAELHDLRAQYNHLTFCNDLDVGVINVNNLGTGNKICKFPDCG